MASNAKFEIEIYGNTAKFENSLKGINTAMSGLKGEASALKKALQLDPTNTDKMAQLQKNLQQQLTVSKNKATQLKQEIADVDKSTPQGQAKWTKLQRDLANTTIQADQLEADIKDVDNAIKNGKWETKAKIDMDTSGVDSKIGGFKQKFNGLKEIAVGAFRQIGASITNALGNGLGGWVSDAMSTQKAMISLKNTMEFKGIGSDVEYVKKSMSTLATATNANTEDTLKLATTFIGLGDNAKTAVSKTDALVKANQAFGGTGEQLKGVVQAYGQMSAAGKVSAENINQLTDNNTALGSALKSTVMEMNPTLKQYGSFAAASEKGAISVEMLDKAMQKLGGAGGGAVTTIGDAWDSFNETLSLALLPTLDALTPVISGLIDKMAGWGDSAGKAIENVVKWVMTLWEELEVSGTLAEFGRVWENVKSILSSVGKIITDVVKSFLPLEKAPKDSADAIGDTMEILWGLAETMQKSTAKIADFVKKISESETAMAVLKGTLVVLASAFAAFKVATGILKAIQAFKTMATAVKLVSVGVKGLFALIAANPFVAIAVAIAAVVAGLVYFFTQTKTGKKMWADFVDFLKSSWDSVVSFFSGIGQWFSDLWNNTVNGAKDIWQGLVDFFNGIVQGIQNTWNGITTFFTNLWTMITGGITTAWQGVTEFFTGLFTGIQNIVTTVFTAISTAVTTAYNWFVTTFQPLISFYQSIFNLIGSIVNLAFQLILAAARGAYQLVLNAWEGLSAWFSGIFNVVSNVVETVFSAIGSFAKSAWGVITNIWNAIAGFFGGIFDAVVKVVANAFNQVVSWAQSAWNRIVGIWNAISGFFSGIFNSVSSTVSGAFNQVAGFAQNAWGRITGIFGGIGNWFGGIFNSVRSIVSSVFDAFGNWARNAYNSITGIFSGIANWFGNVFQGVSDAINSALGWVTKTINGISGALDGISSAVSGLFKGSLVAELSDVNFGNLGSGISQNSASAFDNRTYNTFNIQGGSNQNMSELARAIRREFNEGRA